MAGELSDDQAPLSQREEIEGRLRDKKAYADLAVDHNALVEWGMSKCWGGEATGEPTRLTAN